VPAYVSLQAADELLLRVDFGPRRRAGRETKRRILTTSGCAASTHWNQRRA